jgi:hypothetical protein
MIAILALALAATPPAPLPSPILPPCKAEQLSLGFDAEGGAFDGMSHSGALLVVRNLGPAACRLAGLPTLGFKDKAGQPLPIARQPPVGMHPGPVVLPVALAVGAEATAPLRWTSGEVYSPSRCYTPATATLALDPADPGSAVVSGPVQARICGPARGARFDQPPLRLDPPPPNLPSGAR